MSWYGFRPYVNAATRKSNALKEANKLAKKGHKVAPITIEGRTIATTFWGKAWCENLEGYSDYSNRLPRGRTYVRNGSVVDLQVSQGTITALVSGSSLYKIKIDIKQLQSDRWKSLLGECSGKIDSVLSLLQGKLSQPVMQIMTHREKGLFPKPHEIKMTCSCPDWAGMCKHLAAVLYGIGARLDQTPEMLFLLRGVKHEDLISQAAMAQTLEKTASQGGSEMLTGSDLADVFGIDIDTTPLQKTPAKAQGDITSPSKNRKKATPVKSKKSQKSPRAKNPF
jgi:uncharacterized Zn finger protein